ncbi:MAG: ATP-dependent RecD-like DNA helicase [Clostridia bacterium]
MEEYIYIEGTVSAIIYTNEENGYSVIKIDTAEGEEITATGTMPQISKGEDIVVSGHWQSHKSYGEQFVVDAFEISMPSTEKGIIEYLGSRAVKGVGKKMAEKIVSRFGLDTFRVIAETPELLIEVRGITMKKALEISEKFLRQTQLRSIIEFLLENHLPIELASKLYKQLGDDALFILNENPYILCDEYFEVDFLIVDELAMNLYIDPESNIRAQAGIVYVLKFNLQNGHAFIPKDKLITASSKLLEQNPEQISENLYELVNQKKLNLEQIANIEAVYLSDIYSAECFICDYLTELCKFKYDYDFEIGELIEELESENQIEYADRQKEAIEMAGKSGVVVLTGGPGTGKTTTVRGVLNLFQALGLTVELCAPTGRAAKRLTELCGLEAKTIHRLLEAGFDPAEGKMMFQKNIQNPLDVDAIIVDEASMIDINLIKGLLKALKIGTRIVFVGDPDQLPPVGAGNFLQDIINSECFNVISLTEIFRQAKESMIVINAHGVNQGIMPKTSGAKSDFFIMPREDEDAVIDTVAELCKTRLPNYYKLNPSQIQVLCPSKKTRAGTFAINRRLQEELNPLTDEKQEKRFGDIIFRTGDRVMQIKNNYDVMWTKNDVNGMGMFNGEIGEIVEIDLIEEFLVINFDEKITMYSFDMLNELDLAYALTVHKAQGSEFEAVVLALSKTTPKLLTRSILYTAITRAKNLLVIVGDKEILSQMVDNNFKNKRYSGLKVRIREVNVENN